MNKKAVRVKFPFVLLFMLILFSVFVFVQIFLQYSSSQTDASKEYQITNYAIDVTVKEDNSFLIKETIDANFDLRSHGLMRYIPTKGNVRFTEGGKDYSLRYDLDISYINGSHKCSVSSGDHEIIFRIGDPNRYVFGNEQFSFSYLIQVTGGDPENFDQFYYNFIGDQWDTSIDNLSIDVTFEKPLEDRDFYFYLLGEEIAAPLTDNHVHFSYNKIIPPFHAVTGRVTMEEGYFSIVRTNAFENIYLIVVIVLSAIGLIAGVSAIVIFFVKNNKKKIIPIVEFSPIKGITPVDAGYIIDKETQMGEVSSLIVYWASKGYLSIEEKDDVTTLVKLKDADDEMKDYEKKFFNSIFKEDKFVIGTEDINVAASVNSVKSKVKSENAKFFSKPILALKHTFLVLFAIIFAANAYLSALLTQPNAISLVCCILLGVIVYLSTWMLSIAKDGHITMSKFALIFTIAFGTLFLCAAYIVPIVFAYDSVAMTPLSIILTPLLSSPLVIASLLFNDRVEGENKEVGRIFGLRKFILLAEKNRIEVLAKENPQIFYDVLPYAYVLGISGVWIDKFKDIELPAPEWYVGNTASTFVNIYIANRLLGSMTTFNGVVIKLAPRPNNIRIGGGGHIGGFGGGHIGGGMGGGGGGRW